MRIAMVSEHASPLAVLGGADAGGQNVHVAALSLALAERGHEVEVYTRRTDPAVPEQVWFGPGVRVVHVPAGPPRELAKDELLPFMPAFGHWLAARWAADPPEVVHAHFWMSGVACAYVRRVLGVPVVQTFHALGVVKRRHQGDQDPSPAERETTEAGLAVSADAVIATATEEVRELLDLGAPAGTLHVVPCGVDDFPAGASDEHWWPDPGGRIVSLGRLVPRKGVDTLIRALARLPVGRLVVAGGPVDAFDNDREVVRLRELAHDLRVTDRVRLVGPVNRDQVPGLLRSADVVACTPEYEPFGIVPLEAMACGRPVVASAVGGLLDTVVDQVTGLHVPPGDADRLAAALGELLTDPHCRERMGITGRARVLQQYTWPRIATATEAVYHRVLSPLPAGSGR